MPSIPLPDPPPAGGGVRLRAWREADLPAAHRATLDPLVPRFTRVPEGNTIEQIRAYFATHPADRESGEGLHLAIADEATDAFLGAISLLRFSWPDERCEVGYWLAPEARGRGAATTATRLLSRWALANLPIERVELRTDTENAASQRVAVRAGFVREGVLRSFEKDKGRRSDVVVFSLLRSDLERHRQHEPVAVREARPGDGEAIARIHRDMGELYAALAPSHFQRPELAGLAADIDAWLAAADASALNLIAERDGEVIATLRARILEPEPDAAHEITPDSGARRLRIDYLATAEGRRRSGAGTRLAAAAEEWGRARGATVAETWTYHLSPLSRPFWERRMGYEPRSLNVRKRL